MKNSKSASVHSWPISLLAVLGIALALSQSSQGQNFKVLHTFTGGTDGANPGWVLLVQDAAGTLYGTASAGGAYGSGNIYKLDKSGKETVLYSFTGGSDGWAPVSGVVRDAAGNLYGTTNVGGNPKCKLYESYQHNGCGVVFKFAAGKLTVLHTFMGPDGGYPGASSLAGGNGVFYGTTGGGGVNSNCQDMFDGCGTVFMLTTTSTGWKEKVLYSFGWNKGWQPHAGVITDSQGNLYGTTEGCNNGTQDPCGVVFGLTPSAQGWSYKMLHGFTGGVGGGPDGAFLWGGLVRDSAGNLYGTTENGGKDNYGTIFQLTPSGKKTELYSFKGSDGALPMAGLTLDASGNLYGTTSEGGASQLGTVFKLDTAHHLTVLHSFTGGKDGATPLGPLLLNGGKLYGAADAGGTYNSGTIFEITP